MEAHSWQVKWALDLALKAARFIMLLLKTFSRYIPIRTSAFWALPWYIELPSLPVIAATATVINR